MNGWGLLGNIVNIISIGTFLLALYTAWQLRRQKRRIRELVRQTPKAENFSSKISLNQGVQTISPIALAVSVSPSPKTIVQDVRKFLEKHELKMPIESLDMDGINGEADKEAFYNALVEKKNLFSMQQNTEVHVFMAGPVSGAMWLGAVFDNWIPVKIYQKPNPAPPHVYEYWGPLM